MSGLYDVVVPTIGRRSLARALVALAAARGPRPGRVVVVDDRREPRRRLALPPGLGDRVVVLQSGGRGPAAARNVGWRATSAAWVAFLDDDVVPGPDWAEALTDDLAAVAPDVAGSQGRITVPRPAGRAPTDWERNVIGLEQGRWITADMAYRRDVLARLGGFDGRFRRAYREDAELALRVLAAGFRLVRGRRVTAHPPGSARAFASLRAQAGNADDVVLGALHGPGWRAAAGAPPGALRRHVMVSAAAGAAALGAVLGAPALAATGAAAWAVGTLAFAAARIRPGPRTPREIAEMLVTSAAIPPAAVAWHGVGRLRAARLRAARGRAEPREPASPLLRLVLFDRDGTLIEDVPGSREPARVSPLPTARRALDRLRAHGVSVAVVSNQAAVGEGRVALHDVIRQNARVEQLLGPFAGFFVCPHARDAGCACRKPRPGLLLDAMRAFGVAPGECAMVGDIGSDMEAAAAAGVRGVLVPTPVTREAERSRAPAIAPDLDAAVDRLLRYAP